MSSKKTPQSQVTQLPTDITETVLETPDIKAFREFDPRVSNLSPILATRFGRDRKAVEDSYGAYSGIPSQVARNRLRDMALSDLSANEAAAVGAGVMEGQKMRGDQLGALAALTAGKNRKGFESQQTQQKQGSGGSIISSGIGAGGAVAAALI